MKPWRGYLSDKKIKLLENSWTGNFRNAILPISILAKNNSEDHDRQRKRELADAD